MFKLMYFIWALLPLILFYLSASAGVRKAAHKLKDGYASFHLRQAVYSAITLAIAILIDQTFFYDLLNPLAQLITSDPETLLNVVAWLIYPLLLVFFTTIQQALSKKEEPKVIFRNYR